MKKALILNSDYTPISILPSARAFAIYYKGHADVIYTYPESEYTLSSPNDEYPAPSVIRVNEYADVPYRKVPLTKQNVFKRDNFTCVYCGSKENLTIDHVKPQSKGGKDTWDNLVTACKPCNAKKGDKIIEMPEDLKIYRPHYLLMMSKLGTGNVRTEWKDFLFMN